MADASILREPSKVVADVLISEMGLDDAHCVLGDQPWPIPPDTALYISVFESGPKIIGLKTEMDDSNPPREIQSGSGLYDVRIELYSLVPGKEARTRRMEVGMALASFAAQQAMAASSCQISRILEPVDASESEGAGQVFKYVIHVNVTALFQKIKTSMLYFDKFNGATEDGTANPPQETING